MSQSIYGSTNEEQLQADELEAKMAPVREKIATNVRAGFVSIGVGAALFVGSRLAPWLGALLVVSAALAAWLLTPVVTDLIFNRRYAHLLPLLSRARKPL